MGGSGIAGVARQAFLSVANRKIWPHRDVVPGWIGAGTCAVPGSPDVLTGRTPGAICAWSNPPRGNSESLAISCARARQTFRLRATRDGVDNRQSPTMCCQIPPYHDFSFDPNKLGE